MKKGMVLLLFSFLLFTQEMGYMAMAAAQTHAESALIIVDPGASGFSLKVAQKISDSLNEKCDGGVRIVKAKELKATNLVNIDLLVIGGPTYAKQPSKSLVQALSLVTETGLKTILFQTGGVDCAGIEPLEKLAESMGLAVIGAGRILFNKKDPSYMEEKVNKLLESIA